MSSASTRFIQSKSTNASDFENVIETEPTPDSSASTRPECPLRSVTASAPIGSSGVNAYRGPASCPISATTFSVIGHDHTTRPSTMLTSSGWVVGCSSQTGHDTGRRACLAALFASPVLVLATPSSAAASPDLGTAAACRKFSRSTLTSTPVSATPEEIDPAWDKSVKFFGRAATKVARKTQAGQARRMLIAYAVAARSKKWTSVAEWQTDPAVIQLRMTCQPFLKRPIAPR
jgi:hypothetical protein